MSLQITSIKLEPMQIAGNAQGKGTLLKINDLLDYDNEGKPTGRVIGKKLTMVFEDNEFEKLVVKVSNTSDVITEEELQAENGKIPIILENLAGKFYRTAKGDYAISCTATGVKRVQKP